MGPMPDVDGMRRTAALLNERAANLGAMGARLDAQVAAMVYAGPAADRFRADVALRRQQIGTAAGELQTLADTLTRSAMAAETAIVAGGAVL